MGLQLTPETKSIRREGRDSALTVKTRQGASMNFKQVTVLKSTVSGTGTETITGMIPAGATVFGVVARVVTAITGTVTTWGLGETGAVTRYGATLAKAVGTTVSSANWTAEPTGTWAATARDILLTATSGNFTTGSVRVTLFYRDFTGPTS